MDTPTYHGAVSRSWPFVFFHLVQGLNDFKGQRINVGRFESSLVFKTEIKNSPKVFLEIIGNATGPKPCPRIEI